MQGKLKVTLIRSHIGKPASHRAVLVGMGLNRRLKTVSLPDTPETWGMINKVQHLVKVEE
ncbi:MAG: 50S ribosomal protein L30 [Geobacteraceae bacterium]|nr:50S ribosomal protein L30 [Geobacteraceae bacterium]